MLWMGINHDSPGDNSCFLTMILIVPRRCVGIFQSVLRTYIIRGSLARTWRESKIAILLETIVSFLASSQGLANPAVTEVYHGSTNDMLAHSELCGGQSILVILY